MLLTGLTWRLGPQRAESKSSTVTRRVFQVGGRDCTELHWSKASEVGIRVLREYRNLNQWLSLIFETPDFSSDVPEYRTALFSLTVRSSFLIEISRETVSSFLVLEELLTFLKHSFLNSIPVPPQV